MRKMMKAIAAVLAVSALMAGSAFAAEKFAVKDTAGTTTVFYVDETGMASASKIGVGTATPQVPLHLNLGTQGVGTALYSISTGFTVSTQNNSPAADFTTADSTGTAGFRGSLRGVRSRGSLASPTAAAAEDLIMSVIAGVYDGTAVRNNADINFTVDGAVSTGVAPVRISFRTRTGGAGGYIERLTVKNNGYIGINNNPTPTTYFDINSDTLRLRTAKTPASTTAACNQGDISWDAGYIYVCVATDSWRRAALAAW